MSYLRQNQEAETQVVLHDTPPLLCDSHPPRVPPLGLDLQGKGHWGLSILDLEADFPYAAPLDTSTLA